MKEADDDDLQAKRPSGVGLLILYPINKDSVPARVPKKKESKRVRLRAVEDMMGVGLVFPTAEHTLTAVSYKAVSLPIGDVDDDDEPDPYEVDTEPSLDRVSS